MEQEYGVLINCQQLADWRVRRVHRLRGDIATLRKWSDELETNAYVSDVEKEVRAHILRTSVANLWIGIARKLIKKNSELHQAEDDLAEMKINYPQYLYD
jgi:hypothetical protein